MRKLDRSDFERLAERLRRAPDLVAAWCFGSQADPERQRPQDLGIAVLGTAPLDLGRLLALQADVSDCVRSDAIDLVDLKRAGPVLKRQVLKSGRLLFSRDQSLVNRFDLDALWEYRDSGYRRRVQREYLARKRATP
jgi:uncharacterized protein